MPAADLVLKNAEVITMDPEYPFANLVAVRDGRVRLVGDADRLNDVTGAGTNVIDCGGKTVLPGFTDAHCHVFSFIRKLLSLDLSPPAVTSITDIKAIIARKVKETPSGHWIQGTDYSDFHLEEKCHPTRWDLDEVAPDYPVVLSHRSLHACVLNSRALDLAGITRETPEPPGAMIERDITSGEPNGVLYEMLGHIREKVMPSWTDEELERGMILAGREYLSKGITSLQDATVVNDFRRWQKFRRFIDTGILKSRIYMMVGAEGVAQFREAGLGFGDGDDRLRLGAVKIVPSNIAGQMHPPQAELEQMVLDAQRDGFQVAVHAVRDSTVEAVIRAYERARNESPQTEMRHRIEHCAECPPHLLERLAGSGVVIASQPPFIYFSGDRYRAMVPQEQQQWLYRFRSFFDNGVVMAASSDSPIVPNNPLMGIYGAVTRQTDSGQHLLPHEAVSVHQALIAYTSNAAYASFEEDIKGTITAGKLADMVVLSDNPYTVAPEALKEVRVEMTISGGEVVWEA
ncbi:MAG TPA: amidohydrolase [Dehalococcoidia bacterium]|nr:amidohydrolase [Dehalococcoidia bacterium]